MFSLYNHQIYKIMLHLLPTAFHKKAEYCFSATSASTGTEMFTGIGLLQEFFRGDGVGFVHVDMRE